MTRQDIGENIVEWLRSMGEYCRRTTTNSYRYDEAADEIERLRKREDEIKSEAAELAADLRRAVAERDDAREQRRKWQEASARDRAESKRLQNENAHLQFCLNSRDEFIGSLGQWQAYVDTLPHDRAGVPVGWSDKPTTHEQCPSGEVSNG
jgi:chromosome segregation ATPase